VKHIIELCSTEKYDQNMLNELQPCLLQLPTDSDWSYFVQRIAKNGDNILDDFFVMAGIAYTLQGMTSGEIDNLSEQISKSLGKFNDFLRMKREKLAKVPYESDSGKLDHYAFAEERPGQVPFEKDNKYEKELYQQLLHHFVSNESPSLEAVKTIKDFLVKGEYSTIFHVPEQNVMYRGMVVDDQFMMKALGVNDKNDINPRDGRENMNFTFTPFSSHGATSWTTSLSLAHEFSKFSLDNRHWDLIMFAKVADNPNKFVECKKGLYNVKGFDSYSEEDEVLGLGSIKVYRIGWIDKTRIIPDW
jgi:hypothetical protein